MGIKPQVEDIRFGEDNVDFRTAKETQSMTQIRHLSKNFNKVEVTFVGRHQCVAWKAQLNLSNQIHHASVKRRGNIK